MPRGRADIGVATIHRLLAEQGGFRVSKEAAEVAQKALEEFLESCGAAARKALELKKAKTVTREVLLHILESKCIDASALVLRGRKARGVPEAGAERLFRSKLGKDMRISEEAKKGIQALAEYKIEKIGSRAALVAEAAKTDGSKTIKARHVEAAISILRM